MITKDEMPLQYDMIEQILLTSLWLVSHEMNGEDWEEYAFDRGS